MTIGRYAWRYSNTHRKRSKHESLEIGDCEPPRPPSQSPGMTIRPPKRQWPDGIIELLTPERKSLPKRRFVKVKRDKFYTCHLLTSGKFEQTTTEKSQPLSSFLHETALQVKKPSFSGTSSDNALGTSNKTSLLQKTPMDCVPRTSTRTFDPRCRRHCGLQRCKQPHHQPA
jgi:hypothetical protein